MLLKSLEVVQLRNLQHLKLVPHPAMNFVVGPNGSGKTSLLEAIYLLASGRSFRSPMARKVISHGFQELTVFGEVQDANGTVHRAGISKGLEGETQVRINGTRRERMSDLAALLPAICLDSSSFELVDGGPAERRHLLDWGLFHVEHDFMEHWKRYQVAIKQKAALLRSPASKTVRQQIGHWNTELAGSGEKIDRDRCDYSTKLAVALQDTVNRYVGEELSLSIEYKPGWNKQTHPSLGDCLNGGIDSEIERQLPLYGPHKADLVIKWNGTAARDICSRGQKKLVIYAVRLAQVMTLFRERKVTPLLLLDDLPAELDARNLGNVARFLTDYPCQTFITAIDQQALSQTLLEQFQHHHMFHVEHGQLIQTTSA